MKTTFMTVRLHTPRTVGLRCRLLWSKWLAAGGVIFLSGAPTRCLKEITAVRRWRCSVDLDVICVFVWTADPSLLQSLQADVTDVILTLFTLQFYEIQIPNVRRHMRTSSVFCRTLRSKWVRDYCWWLMSHSSSLLADLRWFSVKPFETKWSVKSLSMVLRNIQEYFHI